MYMQGRAMKWLMRGGVAARAVRLLLIVGVLVASDVGLLPDALVDAALSALHPELRP